MKVTVTWNDINLGYTNSSCYCPIARAIKRLGHKDVWVRTTYCEFGGQRYNLPSKVVKFIAYFDGHLSVEPMEFTI